jgi:hypothetical protein
MKEKLEQIKKIAESFGVPFEEANGTLVLGVEEANNVDLDLMDFLKIYVKDNGDIISSGGVYTIKVKTIGATNLKLMLQSLFSDLYDITVEDQETIIISKKGSTQSENAQVDFSVLAERLDNDFVEIEVFEDQIVIMSEREKTLETVAKLADEFNDKLNIEIQRKQVVIK